MDSSSVTTMYPFGFACEVVGDGEGGKDAAEVEGEGAARVESSSTMDLWSARI